MYTCIRRFVVLGVYIYVFISVHVSTCTYMIVWLYAYDTYFSRYVSGMRSVGTLLGPGSSNPGYSVTTVGS